MKYTMQAHPTIYRGVQYRSRLEARYAAFFDLLEWPYEYEPMDLRGWSPDFSILGKQQPVLVEIKPYASWDETEETRAKIERAINGEYDAMLCGAFCQPAKHWSGQTCGWLYQGDPDWQVGWDEAILSPVHDCGDGCSPERLEQGWIGLIHPSGSFRDRIRGAYDGDHHLYANNVTDADVYARWVQAGNIVQWTPK